MGFFFFPVGGGASVATATPGVDLTGLDLVREALLELGVINPTEAPPGKTADHGLAKLNELLDAWNADRLCTFASAFTPWALTPGLSPHLIGPSGTFVVVQRPETLEGANLIYPGAPAIRIPLTLRDRQWWLAQSVQGLSTTIPTDLYYEPAWPNGQLFLWPVPSAAYQIELLTRVLIAGMTLTSQLSAPPGYRTAIVKTLAEELQPSMRVPMPDGLPRQAEIARARIFGKHDVTPRLETRDAGLPGGGGGSFNYLTGSSR